MIGNKITRYKIIIIISFFILLTLIFSWPILKSGNNLGIEDWDQQIEYLEVARKTVLEHHQLPLWDPYHCGGMPILGNPQSGFISITFLLSLLFGTIWGIKLSIAFHYLTAFLGTYFLSKYLKFSNIASIYSSILFTCSGVISSALSTGMLTFLYATYLPLIMLFTIKAIADDRKQIQNIILAGFFISLTYYGGYQIPIVAIPVFVIYLLIESFASKNIKPILTGIGIGIMFILFSIPKLILNINLMQSYPRLITDSSGYSLKGIFYFLISPIQNIQNDLLIKSGADYNFGIDENSLYIGFFGFIITIIGIIKSKPKFKILFLLILILMRGYFSPIPLFDLLRKLPFYNQFEVSQRFRFPFILILAIASAIGFDHINTKFKNKYVTSCIVIFLFIDLVIFTHTNFFTQTFIIKNEWIKSVNTKNSQPKIVNNVDITYTRIKSSQIQDSYNHSFEPWSTGYPSIRQNISYIDCYESVPVKKDRSVTSLEFLPNDTEKTITTNWTPNRIDLNVEKFTGNNIHINQNFVRGWYSKNEKGELRKVTSVDGILNIENLPGDKIISLIYNPFKITK